MAESSETVNDSLCCFFPIAHLYAPSVPWVRRLMKAVISVEVSGLANYHTSTTAQNHQHIYHTTPRMTDGES